MRECVSDDTQLTERFGCLETMKQMEFLWIYRLTAASIKATVFGSEPLVCFSRFNRATKLIFEFRRRRFSTWSLAIWSLSSSIRTDSVELSLVTCLFTSRYFFLTRLSISQSHHSRKNKTHNSQTPSAHRSGRPPYGSRASKPSLLVVVDLQVQLGSCQSHVPLNELRLLSLLNPALDK